MLARQTAYPRTYLIPPLSNSRQLQHLAANDKFQEIPIAFPRTYEAALRQVVVSCHATATGDIHMKETTITIETFSLLVLRTGELRTMWCAACNANVPILELAVRDLWALRRLPRHLHHFDAAHGTALICLNSLLCAIADDRS